MEGLFSLKQNITFFQPLLKQKRLVPLFTYRFFPEQKITETSRHSKNGVLPIPDALAWLSENKMLNIDNIPDDFDEEKEHESEDGLLGLLKLLLG